MANKTQLLKIAKSLGIKCDKRWSNANLEAAIEQADNERRETEKANEELREEAGDEGDSNDELSVAVGVMEATINAGDDGEFGTADDIVDIRPIEKDTIASAEKAEVPDIATGDGSEDVPPPYEKDLPQAGAKIYRCLSGMTWMGKIYDIGDTVSMDDDSAEVHVKGGALCEVGAEEKHIEKIKSSPIGEYLLAYGITLNGKAYKAGDVVELTAEKALEMDKVGAIDHSED